MKKSQQRPVKSSEHITAAKIVAWATVIAAAIGALTAIIIAIANKAQDPKPTDPLKAERSEHKSKPFIRNKPQKQEEPAQELAGTIWRIRIGKIGSYPQDFDSFTFLESGGVESSVISTDLTGWMLSGNTVYIEFSNLGSPDDDVVMEFNGTLVDDHIEGRLKNRAVKSSQMEMIWEANRVR